ncbi:hypothetical protein COHA_004863 [Chlorella ohadii]|uniref:Uncharacterized protein n=1 Tax=Chlorella ohadii TaxID=2649997 RepID=A0AAD5DW77_9CHLO|nr:hypothetical protein COHA_004863 [Chlorella ohadii]
MGRKDAELAQQAQQVAQQAQQLREARREAAATDERMQQMKQAVAAEALAAAEVLDKAEQAAQLLGQQLLSMMQSRQGDESDGEEEEVAVLRSAQGERLSQEDADALFEELEFLQQQLAAKQAAAEDALNRAEAAEAEASSLRERLINAAAVPPPVAAAGYNASLEKELMGCRVDRLVVAGHNASLEKELAAAQSAAAAAEAEAQAMASQNSALQEEVSRLRQAAQAASAAAGSAAKPKGFGAPARDGNELAAALARVSDLERQCAELRDAAARKDAVLAKSRKFIESYLSRSSVQRMTRGASGAADEDGASVNGQ